MKNIDADREWVQALLDVCEKDLNDTKINLAKVSKEKDWLSKDSSEAQQSLE